MTWMELARQRGGSALRALFRGVAWVFTKDSGNSMAWTPVLLVAVALLLTLVYRQDLARRVVVHPFTVSKAAKEAGLTDVALAERLAAHIERARIDIVSHTRRVNRAVPQLESGARGRAPAVTASGARVLAPQEIEVAGIKFSPRDLLRMAGVSGGALSVLGSLTEGSETSTGAQSCQTLSIRMRGQALGPIEACDLDQALAKAAVWVLELSEPFSMAMGYYAAGDSAKLAALGRQVQRMQNSDEELAAAVFAEALYRLLESDYSWDECIEMFDLASELAPEQWLTRVMAGDTFK